MSDPRKKTNPKTTNEILLDRGIRHAIFLVRLAGGEANWIKEKMPQLRKSITEAIVPILTDIESSGVISATDEVLIHEASTKAAKAAQEFFEKVQGELEPRLVEIAAFEADFERRLFEKAIPIEMNFKVPSDQQLKSFLSNEAISGKTMNQWFNDLTVNTRTLVNDEIRKGLIEGESIGDIVRRIRGRRSKGYADGVLNTTTRHAEALARTGVMSASNKARSAFHEANSEVISGYEWVLTLDDRTCSICVSGESQNPYPVENPPELPAHIGCRCLRVCVTKSWKELGIDIDEAPPGTRASMNGERPGTMTYEEWFKDQKEPLQKDILGESRFQGFKQGHPVTAFAENGKTLTLDQLRSRDPDLFPILPASLPKTGPRTSVLSTHKGHVKEWAKDAGVKSALVDYEKGRGYFVNNALRGQGTFSESSQALKDKLDKVFAPDAPRIEGTFYRGIGANDNDFVWQHYKGLKVGRVDKFKGFTSTSTKRSVANTFSSMEGTNRIVMRIKGKNGVYISELAGNPTESEVLFNHGAQMKLTKRNLKGSLLELWFEEI